MYSAPKEFLFIIVQSPGDPALVEHLVRTSESKGIPVADLLQNSYILMAHRHDSVDGFPNLEETSQPANPDSVSISSVLHRQSTKTLPGPRGHNLISVQDIRGLASSTGDVTMTVETKSYLHNLVVFLRMNRAVQKGVTPVATTHLELLSKSV